MDVNGTRFHLLIGGNDWWRQGQDADGAPLPLEGSPPDTPVDTAHLHWDTTKNELTLAPKAFTFRGGYEGRALNPAMRRGSACDRFGNWYWIDPTETSIIIRSSGSRSDSPFWPVPKNERDETARDSEAFRPIVTSVPPPPSLLRGLAITDDNYLLAGVVEPQGLMIFDLFAGGPPRRVYWPKEAPFHPFDMAPRNGGGVWILDRLIESGAGEAKIWELDRNFEVVRRGQSTTRIVAGENFDFGAASSPPESPQCKGFADGISLSDASPPGSTDPVAVEGLPDNSVLVLDSGGSLGQWKIRRYHCRDAQWQGEDLYTWYPENLPPVASPPAKVPVGYDFAYVENPEESVTDRIFVVTTEGNQAFAIDIDKKSDGTIIEKWRKEYYFPLRLFSGKGLVAAGKSGVFYDLGGRWVPLIRQERPVFAREGTFVSKIFDGHERACVWHRLIIDARVPEGTSLTIDSRASDDSATLPMADWQPEPKPLRRHDGSEIPYCAVPQSDGWGCWETLFQKAQGQYLQIRLTLTGDGRTSPRVRALRAYYPRFSYLNRYLPSIYRDDAVSASFLDRFLSNMEGVFTSIEDRIAAAQVLFDWRTVPAEALEWLVGWFGVVVDPSIDELRKRLLIRHAMTLFAWRGTVRGVRMALRLVFDAVPTEAIFDKDPSDECNSRGIKIVEGFRARMSALHATAENRAMSMLQTVSNSGAWRPSNGIFDLHKRYGDAIKAFNDQKIATGQNDVKAVMDFPLLVPVSIDKELRALYEWFSVKNLGFVPSATNTETEQWQDYLVATYRTTAAYNAKYHPDGANLLTDLATIELPTDEPPAGAGLDDWTNYIQLSNGWPLSRPRMYWQQFLARRYRTVESFNNISNTHWSSFDRISLPARVPQTDAAFRDWYQFESIVLPMHDSAHRFTVYLAANKTDDSDPAVSRRMVDLVRHIIDMEKPAHTVFDVRMYWDAFLIGQAMLGVETILGQSSRLAGFFKPMLLDHGYLAQGYLANPCLSGSEERFMIGRERARGSVPSIDYC